MKRLLFSLLLAAGLAGAYAAMPVFPGDDFAKGSPSGRISLAPDISWKGAGEGAGDTERLLLVAGDPSRNLSGFTARDISGREISFARGTDGSPLTVVSFFSSSC